MKIQYAVWWIPTKKGMEAFGWQPRALNVHDDKDDADMEAYLEDCDEPAPDKAEYGSCHVIKFQNHEIICSCNNFNISRTCPTHGDTKPQS